MAREKAKDLRGLNVNDLKRRIEDAHEELFKLRFQLASKQLSNTNRIREVRHNLARLTTLIQEQELVG